MSETIEASNDATVRLLRGDNVRIALRDLPAGAVLPEGIRLHAPVPAGHKIALEAIARGGHVRKFGQIIGVALADIAPGEHVHVHNLGMPSRGERLPAGQVASGDTEPTGATFEGFVREDGRVGTRNYIGVLTTVTCSGTVAQTIADEVERRGILADFPNIDGVVPIAHGTGCGMGRGLGMELLQRTLWGYASHPNMGGVLVVGLGCEVNQLPLMMEAFGMTPGERMQVFNIQDLGGTRATVEAGVAAIAAMAPGVNEARRETRPASDLVLAVQCGGSDGFSGISANPALGRTSDFLVADGGTVILAETTEIYGADHLLRARAVSEEVGVKLDELILWWEDYVARNDGEIDNNPTPGNKRGGLTTIVEKSLGAVAKGGTSPLVDVCRYAERPRNRGLIFMDSPGFDPCSITGQIASGATVVCFTTGRGSTTGYKPSPCLKLASNSAMFEKMKDDMDIDCGGVLTGRATLDDLGSQIYRRVLETASGTETRSEALGYGRNEFVPWQIGAVV